MLEHTGVTVLMCVHDDPYLTQGLCLSLYPHKLTSVSTVVTKKS